MQDKGQEWTWGVDLETKCHPVNSVRWSGANPFSARSTDSVHSRRGMHLSQFCWELAASRHVYSFGCAVSPSPSV